MYSKMLWLILVTLSLKLSAVTQYPEDYPLLVIGGSYSNGSTPYNNGIAPLGGSSVGFGSYLSLGQALTREPILSGYVINEGQAGATTFSRLWCIPGVTSCGPAAWESYETMYMKALSRVALPPTFTAFNAKFVVVTLPNDCIHSDAFGVPQTSATPCTLTEMNQVVDRLVSVGQLALSTGITPIFDIPPKYENLNLELFKNLFGLVWVIDGASYSQYRDLINNRLTTELPQAMVLDIWKEFTHIGDGIHPDYETAKKAAKTIAKKISSTAKRK